LAAETDVPAVLHQLEEVRPRLLVVDSVQTVAHPDVDGAAGGVSQVRAVAAALARVAKANGITVLLVGHVTKEGSVAGPRSLEHLVDVVLFFEGERHSRLRLLRAVKNRFGGTEELGCFDLGADGIVGLADPSGLFLSRTQRQVPGTCVTVTLDGRRALLAEVQALVAAAGPAPRRVCSGVDPARLAMVLAVLDRRAGVPVSGRDVYTATVGGARLNDPAADLAAALAIAGAASDRITPAELVAIGEVGLAGEVRSVRGLDRRLAEAARLGFRRAVVPADVDPAPDGLLLQPVAHLADALAVLTRPTVTVLSPDELMIAGKLG
jgi:DNA repair protein RadA/Sms